ncbi:MAG: hypothetical protein QOC78_1781 [Solirubrobacteraceae bacterium]|jgi:hypothetical protein|nr:hypothetical protein [Solirubrobacteraceae bacterium]
MVRSVRTTRATTYQCHDLRPPARVAGPGDVRIGVTWFLLAVLGWLVVTVGALGAFGVWLGLMVAGGLLVALAWGTVALFVSVALVTVRRAAWNVDREDER